mmetsp:Transcript_23401/g.3841  ORF Transcript_23401/g.3841 Transcript_23401/m.3841 type:complete len:80 (-) Transcript_23401:889-1128(-)
MKLSVFFLHLILPYLVILNSMPSLFIYKVISYKISLGCLPVYIDKYPLLALIPLASVLLKGDSLRFLIYNLYEFYIGGG